MSKDSTTGKGSTALTVERQHILNKCIEALETVLEGLRTIRDA
jgi:hypothetical protein